jgi:SPP1 family predicted phage head-tail adaptor
MIVGKLDKRIVIEEQSGTTQDEFGAVVENWTALLGADASIVPLQGFERYAAQQANSTVSHKITMRYRDGIDAKKRVKFGIRIFDIEAVINLEEKNRWLELSCTEAT